MRKITVLNSLTNQTVVDYITISELIEDIVSPSRLTKSLINQYRLTGNKDLKKQLQPYIYNSIINGHTKDKNSKLSGCFFIDIDKIDNVNEVKTTLHNLEYVKCVYISASGKGVHAIAYYTPDNLQYKDFIDVYNTFEKRIKEDTNLQIDKATKNVNRCVFTSYDEDALHKEDDAVKPLYIDFKASISTDNAEVDTEFHIIKECSREQINVQFDNIDRNPDKPIWVTENYAVMNVYSFDKVTKKPSLRRIADGERNVELFKLALQARLVHKDKPVEYLKNVIFFINRFILIHPLSDKEVMSIFNSAMKSDILPIMNTKLKYTANPLFYNNKKDKLVATWNARKTDKDLAIMSCFDCSLTLEDNINFLSSYFKDITVNRLKLALKRCGVQIIGDINDTKIYDNYDSSLSLKNNVDNYNVLYEDKINVSKLRRILKNYVKYDVIVEDDDIDVDEYVDVDYNLNEIMFRTSVDF